MDQTSPFDEWLEKQEEWRDRDDTFYWRLSGDENEESDS